MKIERPKSKQNMPDEAKKVFSGEIFDVYQWEQKMYDGSKQIFEKLKRPDTAIVFPVTDDGKIILTEQEQPGKEPYISACGGRIEKDEDVLEAAKRELLEESGYVANEYVLWKATHTHTKIDYVIYVFIAKGCKKVKEPKLDSGEKIKLKFVTFDEFVKMVRNEKFVEKEILTDLYEALLDKKKYEELRKLFM